MKTFEYTFSAGETKTFPGGHYFHLITTTDPVDVDFLLNSTSINQQATGVEAGYWAEAQAEGYGNANSADHFDQINITSATAQTVKIGIAKGRGGYDRSQGDVNATTVLGATVANATHTVGTSAAVLLAADSDRKSVFIYNNSTTATIYVGATGVTTSNGWPIPPKGGLSIDRSPKAAIYAIASAAATNVRSLVEKV